MAFSYTVQGQTYFGNKRVVYGTYASTGGSTGGDIVTGLTMCESIMLQPTGAAVGTNQAVVNETLPVSGGSMTIVTDANAAGQFIAYGW